MKRLKFITLVFLAGTLAATAQKSNAIQKVYDTFEDQEDVWALSFSKNMEDVLDADMEWGDQMKYIEGDVTKVSTMIISENANSKKTLRKMKDMIENLGYHQIEIPEDEEELEDSEVFIYARGKKGRYDEIHMLIIDNDDNSGVLISTFGDITVTD